MIIGERINPTGRKMLAAEMAAGNFDRVRSDAIAQVAAGAQMLDVNAGIPLADEPGILAEAIRLVQSVVDVPLSIDSSIVAALEAGLAAYQGKPLVNSVTGEEERLEMVLPLVAQYHAAVIGISNDETGISEDPDVRFEIAKSIVERAETYGIPREDVLIDPLAMPIGAVRYAGRSAVHAGAAAARRAGRQRLLRRVKHLVWPAQPAHAQRRLPGDGDQRRHELRHHQRARAGNPQHHHGGRRDDGPRRELRGVAEGSAGRRRRKARAMP